jgi:hypothetical protein
MSNNQQKPNEQQPNSQAYQPYAYQYPYGYYPYGYSTSVTPQAPNNTSSQTSPSVPQNTTTPSVPVYSYYVMPQQGGQQVPQAYPMMTYPPVVPQQTSQQESNTTSPQVPQQAMGYPYYPYMYYPQYYMQPQQPSTTPQQQVTTLQQVAPTTDGQGSFQPTVNPLQQTQQQVPQQDVISQPTVVDTVQHSISTLSISQQVQPKVEDQTFSMKSATANMSLAEKRAWLERQKNPSIQQNNPQSVVPTTPQTQQSSPQQSSEVPPAPAFSPNTTSYPSKKSDPQEIDVMTQTTEPTSKQNSLQIEGLNTSSNAPLLIKKALRTQKSIIEEKNKSLRLAIGKQVVVNVDWSQLAEGLSDKAVIVDSIYDNYITNFTTYLEEFLNTDEKKKQFHTKFTGNEVQISQLNFSIPEYEYHTTTITQDGNIKIWIKNNSLGKGTVFPSIVGAHLAKLTDIPAPAKYPEDILSQVRKLFDGEGIEDAWADNPNFIKQLRTDIIPALKKEVSQYNSIVMVDVCSFKHWPVPEKTFKNTIISFLRSIPILCRNSSKEIPPIIYYGAQESEFTNEEYVVSRKNEQGVMFMGIRVARMTDEYYFKPKPVVSYDDDDDDDGGYSEGGSSSSKKSSGPKYRTCPHCRGNGTSVCMCSTPKHCKQCGGRKRKTCTPCKGSGQLRA